MPCRCMAREALTSQRGASIIRLCSEEAEVELKVVDALPHEECDAHIWPPRCFFRVADVVYSYCSY